MCKVIVLSLLSFWVHCFIGYEFLPPKPTAHWWAIPLLVTLMVSWGGSILWLVHKEIEK